MLKRKPIKKRVVKRKNPDKVKIKDLLGDKVTVSHKYGMAQGKLTLNKEDDEFQVIVGTGGLDGIGFIGFIDGDIKSIGTNANGSVTIYLK